MSDGTALMKGGAQRGYGTTTTVDESVEAPHQPQEGGSSTGPKVAIGLVVLFSVGAGVFLAGKHSTAVLEWQAKFVEEHHSLGIVLCIAGLLPWIVLCLPTTLYEILVGFMVRIAQITALRSRPSRFLFFRLSGIRVSRGRYALMLTGVLRCSSARGLGR